MGEWHPASSRGGPKSGRAWVDDHPGTLSALNPVEVGFIQEARLEMAWSISAMRAAGRSDEQSETLSERRERAMVDEGRRCRVAGQLRGACVSGGPHFPACSRGK